jgi:ribosomal protein L37AE/L43A
MLIECGVCNEMVEFDVMEEDEDVWYECDGCRDREESKTDNELSAECPYCNYHHEIDSLRSGIFDCYECGRAILLEVTEHVNYNCQKYVDY